MDTIDFQDPDWVEKAWIHEDRSGICQHAVRGRRDDHGVEYFGIHRLKNLYDPADSALEIFPEEGGIEVAPVLRRDLDSCISQRPDKSHQCDRCNLPAFKYPKDLSRHINDIHETTKRYRCPVDGCKYSGATVGHSFKRKDNFRRHLREQHADCLDKDLDMDLEGFFIVD
ncbi:hypothetical protein BKA65DRAFT_516973 [Rhexocercosporidium sp. MPI-PUGE-AT-0058]|nr:hypothetical protein BKA65DRAFT_516973 [Rhexocercosporidium sp. MPI-PUGE-AT-0058]